MLPEDFYGRKLIYNKTTRRKIMFCENCGNEIEKTSKFCPVCGQRVEAAGAGFKGRKRTGTPARAVSRNLIYGFLGLFAVAVVVIGTVKLLGGQKNRENPAGKAVCGIC